MSEQEILQELKKLIYENFGVEVSEEHRSLFSTDIGMFPRDLVKLVKLIEHNFHIKFSESELGRDEFDYPREIASIIFAHLSE